MRDDDEWYAIADGELHGMVVYGWPKTRKFVEEYPGAYFKGFPTSTAAEEWLKVQQGLNFQEGYEIVVSTEDGSLVQEQIDLARITVRHWRELGQRWPPAIFIYPTAEAAGRALDYGDEGDRRRQIYRAWKL